MAGQYLVFYAPVSRPNSVMDSSDCEEREVLTVFASMWTRFLAGPANSTTVSAGRSGQYGPYSTRITYSYMY